MPPKITLTPKYVISTDRKAKMQNKWKALELRYIP